MMPWTCCADQVIFLLVWMYDIQVSARVVVAWLMCGGGDQVAVAICTGVSVPPAEVPADSKSMEVKVAWFITEVMGYLMVNERPLFSLQARLREL